MQVTTTIHGDSDIPPSIKKFQYSESDDHIFIACNKIKEMLERQQRINLNDAILLFTVFVISNMNKDKDTIREEASLILSPSQVMIGVPEMLQKMDFEVIGDKRFVISLNRPI